MGLASIYAAALAAASVEFFFCTVYSSKLESNTIVLLLEDRVEVSVAVRPGLVLNTVVMKVRVNYD